MVGGFFGFKTQSQCFTDKRPLTKNNLENFVEHRLVVSIQSGKILALLQPDALTNHVLHCCFSLLMFWLGIFRSGFEHILKDGVLNGCVMLVVKRALKQDFDLTCLLKPKVQLHVPHHGVLHRRC